MKNKKFAKSLSNIIEKQFPNANKTEKSDTLKIMLRLLEALKKSDIEKAEQILREESDSLVKLS